PGVVTGPAGTTLPVLEPRDREEIVVQTGVVGDLVERDDGARLGRRVLDRARAGRLEPPHRPPPLAPDDLDRLGPVAIERDATEEQVVTAEEELVAREGKLLPRRRHEGHARARRRVAGNVRGGRGRGD